MKDGLVLMYMKDEVLYPVAMTESQFNMLQFLGKTLEPIKIVFDQPQGSAVNLTQKKK